MDLSLKCLQIPLPEDIRKLKGRGDFDLAQKVIDQRLTADIPTALRERLEIEKHILERIKDEYPFNHDQALKAMQDTFTDVREEDLQAVFEEDAADWIYLEGEPHFKDNFLSNLVKTRKFWESRVKEPGSVKDKEGNFSLLDGCIKEMKEKGKLAYLLELELSLKVKPDFYEEEEIAVHLPLPVEYSQVKQVNLLDINPQPTYIGKPDHKQRSVYFKGEFPQEEIFKVAFSLENHMTYMEPDPARVSLLQPNFYTEELAPHIVFTPLIKSVTEEIVGDEQNPLIKARKIYDFVTSKIIYSFMRPYITMPNIPEFCLTSRKGDCGVLALTFITLCRCAGIPARWQSGLYANPLSVGNHDWAQYYVEPYGWLFADCSFGGSAFRAGNMERWNFYAYNLEPFRVPLASEFQYPLYPEKKFLRNDPYDNQIGEAEYTTHGLWNKHYETQAKILRIEKI